MRYGLILVASAIDDQIAAARAAEAAGFDSVWTTEFFNQHGLVRIGLVAQATERIEVGTAISYAFMRTPVLAAAAAMDIDEVSKGRFVLGLGSGTRRMNQDWYSIPFDDPPAPRMREAVALIRACFAARDGGGLSFEGSHYQVRIPQYRRPGTARDGVPIYLAAVNRGMIRTAAAVGDGLVGHPIFTRKYIADVVRPELEDSPCELVPYVICSVSDDEDEARREARAQIAFYYSTRLYHSVLDVHGWRDVGEAIVAAFKRGDFAAMTAAVPDELVDAIAVAGRPDEVRQRIEQWRGLADHLLLYAPSAGVSLERVRENLGAIVETFGTR